MKHVVTLICISLNLFSCANSNESNLAEQIFTDLKPQEAYVLIKIDTDRFYPAESRFIGNINLGSSFSDINVIDQYGGNIQLQMSKKNWLQNDNFLFHVSPNTTMDYPNYGSMLIGRKKAGNLEGYILSRAIFNWTILNEQRAILNIDGFVVRPQDAIMSEFEIPIQGTIYFKQPQIDFNDLDEKVLKLN